jgi:hypothetical protein
MADVYWREENVMAERFAPKYVALGNAQERGFINELGFEVFTRAFSDTARPIGRREELLAHAQAALPAVAEYINRLGPARKVIPEAIGVWRLTEAVVLAERLLRFYDEYERGRPIIFRPKFTGCGIIAACEGDVVAGYTLYEVKAGDRGFRSLDLRQLFIYCALNKAAQKAAIRRIGLVNPRLGTFWVRNVDAVAQRVGGTDAAELLDSIIDYAATSNDYVGSQ